MYFTKNGTDPPCFKIYKKTQPLSKISTIVNFLCTFYACLCIIRAFIDILNLFRDRSEFSAVASSLMLSSLKSVLREVLRVCSNAASWRPNNT